MMNSEKTSEMTRLVAAIAATAADALDSTESKLSGEAEAWVDGSYDNRTSIYGWGLVIKHSDLPVSTFNGTGNGPEASMNNVAGELKAALEAVRYALKNNFKSIVIYHDYEGIGAWADGSWKAKKSYTAQYAEYVRKARSTGLKITFKKVAGHSGNWGNEKADSLARAALNKEVR